MKKILSVFLFVAFIFLLNAKVKAYKVVSSFPNTITSSTTGLMTQDSTNIYAKFYGDGRAFCTRFWNNFASTTCSATWWNSDYTNETDLTKITKNRRIAAAVGAMINKARSLSGGSQNQIDTDVYFYTEMAINNFLYNYNGKLSVNNVARLRNWSNISSRATYKAIYSAGTTAYDEYGKNTAQFSNLNVSKDDSGKITATANLTCYDSKGNKIRCAARCKQTVTITVTYNDGTKKEQKDITAACPKSDLGMYYTYTAEHTFENPENITKIEAAFNTINYTSYPVAQEYYCGSSYYQNLTPNLVKTIDYQYPVSKKITKDIATCAVKLIKRDGSTPLAGAKFELYDGDTKVDTGVSGADGIITFDGLLPDKTYKYKEVKAPKGYVLNGNLVDVTCGDTIVNNSRATGSLTIKKTDGNGNNVAGAKIKVYTISLENGSIGNSSQMDKDSQSDGDYIVLDGNTYKVNYMTFDGNDYFITTTTPRVITGLDLDETYYVEEIEVPENSDYAIKVSSDSVKIVEATNYSVELINIHSNFKISKQDITSKKELPGARIIITDIYGNSVEEWTSTEVPHEVKGLADGEYILTEITAPKGYQKAESIKFTIENGKLKDNANNTLIMYDDTEKVKVPDTLSARNILIVTIGMLIVGVGIAVFLQGVKKKDEI